MISKPTPYLLLCIIHVRRSNIINLAGGRAQAGRPGRNETKRNEEAAVEYLGIGIIGNN